MNSRNSNLGPKISVVLVDGSYRSHFTVIDSLKQQTLAADDYEVLWVEYFKEVKQELVLRAAGHLNFRMIALGGDGTYHSSLCFNRGIVESRGDVLVILDADVLVEPDFLETIWNEHRKNEELVMYVFRMDEPRRTSPLRPELDYLRQVCALTNPENYGGCLTVRKKWLLKINGYEQHEIFRGGAHANGRDMYTRFKNLGMQIKWHPGLRLYHPWHSHPPQFQDGYLLQHVLIKHRAKFLDILPFQGIDPALDRGIPGMLQAQLDREMNKQAEGQPLSD